MLIPWYNFVVHVEDVSPPVVVRPELHVDRVPTAHIGIPARPVAGLADGAEMADQIVRVFLFSLVDKEARFVAEGMVLALTAVAEETLRKWRQQFHDTLGMFYQCCVVSKIFL